VTAPTGYEEPEPGLDLVMGERRASCGRPIHLLLYGPPAVGKKTVGQALSLITGYPLVDNHLTGDIGRRIFSGRSAAHAELVDNLRLEIARAAAARGTDLITTWMFDPAVDRVFARRLGEAVELAGGILTRVQLVAPAAVLLDRVRAPSRQAKNAIRDPEELERQLRERELFERISDDDLVMDTSAASAADLASRIRHEVFGSTEGAGAGAPLPERVVPAPPALPPEG
jgi:hypothetical protein